MPDDSVMEPQVVFQVIQLLGRKIHLQEDIIAFPEILDGICQTPPPPEIYFGDGSIARSDPFLDHLDHGLRFSLWHANRNNKP